MKQTAPVCTVPLVTKPDRRAIATKNTPAAAISTNKYHRGIPKKHKHNRGMLWAKKLKEKKNIVTPVQCRRCTCVMEATTRSFHVVIFFPATYITYQWFLVYISLPQCYSALSHFAKGVYMYPFGVVGLCPRKASDSVGSIRTLERRIDKTENVYYSVSSKDNTSAEG